MFRDNIHFEVSSQAICHKKDDGSLVIISLENDECYYTAEGVYSFILDYISHNKPTYVDLKNILRSQVKTDEEEINSRLSAFLENLITLGLLQNS